MSAISTTTDYMTLDSVANRLQDLLLRQCAVVFDDEAVILENLLQSLQIGYTKSFDPLAHTVILELND